MQTGINDYKSYLASCSLESVAKKTIDELFGILKKDNDGDEFVIGFHIRHFLDSTSPTYVARHSNQAFQSDVENAIASNIKEGRHTFNHLIDALYYQKSEPKKSAPDDLFIQTKILFEELENDGQTFIKKAKTGTLKLHGLPDDQDKVKNMFFELFPTLYKFCDNVGIDHNSVNLKAIHNSIVQLIPFKKYGNFIDVLVLRPKFEIGYVVGFTLIRKKQNFNVKRTVDRLTQLFNFLNYQKDFDGNLLKEFRESTVFPIHQIENTNGFTYNDAQSIPDEIIKSIIDDITKSAVSVRKLPFNLRKDFNDKDKIRDNPLFISLTSFMNILYEFSDEQVEGKKITYGFVLGNPGLFDFLEGNNVFPSITDGSKKKFLDLDGYRKNYHLFSNHLETALVMPYTDIQLKDNSNFPFFFMDIKNFEEDIFNWNYGALIPTQYRPYAYISYRFPWAVSAVVGPGSQIRIFSNGKIIAFKDGKGWKVYGEAVNKLKNFSCWSNESEKAKIEKFLDIVCLLSPIYNIDSHGGFVTFTSELPKEKKKQDEYFKNFQPLANQEPRWQEDCQWLKGRNLFKADGEIDYEVAQRLIQISVLDGATVFVNENYEINNFGMRLNFEAKKKGATSYGGTKTKSAQSYVEWCKENGIKKTFAIAISSDGPLKIFHADSKQSNELVPLYIYNKVKNAKR